MSTSHRAAALFAFAQLTGCATAAESTLHLEPKVGASQSLILSAAIKEPQDGAPRPPLTLEVHAGVVESRDGEVHVDLDASPQQTLACAPSIRAQAAVARDGSLLRSAFSVPDEDDPRIARSNDETVTAITAFVDGLSLVGMSLAPEGVIAPGARWSGSATVRVGGTMIARKIAYQLVDIDAVGARVRIRGMFDGPALDGRLVGLLRWAWAQPFPVAGTLTIVLRSRTVELSWGDL